MLSRCFGFTKQHKRRRQGSSRPTFLKGVRFSSWDLLSHPNANHRNEKVCAVCFRFGPCMMGAHEEQQIQLHNNNEYAFADAKVKVVLVVEEAMEAEIGYGEQ